MMTFWNSVAVLRRIEYVALLLAMITPVVCGTLLLTVRYRIKTLINRTSETQGLSFEENIQRLEMSNHALRHDLERTRTELVSLRQYTAPRQITESQQNIIIDKLRSVKADPVIVSAYAFETESASYGTAIAAVLRKAGWDVTTNKASMNDFKGVSLGAINLTHRALSGEHELAQAFMAAGIEVHQRQIASDTIAGKLQDGSLIVVVGRK